MVLMNDFQSTAASNSKQSPSPHRPDASYLPLREKWMNGPLWNKWSLSVWHLQMNPSGKTKSLYLFYESWRWFSCTGAQNCENVNCTTQVVIYKNALSSTFCESHLSVFKRRVGCDDWYQSCLVLRPRDGGRTFVEGTDCICAVNKRKQWQHAACCHSGKMKFGESRLVIYINAGQTNKALCVHSKLLYINSCKFTNIHFYIPVCFGIEYTTRDVLIF